MHESFSFLKSRIVLVNPLRSEISTAGACIHLLVSKEMTPSDISLYKKGQEGMTREKGHED
jgi:hypothetical protein